MQSKRAVPTTTCCILTIRMRKCQSTDAGRDVTTSVNPSVDS